MRHLDTLARFTDRQLGLVTRAQVRDSGLTDDQLRYLLRSRTLIRMFPRVFRTAGSPATAEQLALGACLQCGHDAVASFGTAAALLGILEHGDQPHVTVPARRRLAVPGIHVHRSWLEPADRAAVGAVPTTSARRTLLDLAGVLSHDKIEELVDDAFRRKLTTPQSLLSYVEQPRFGRAKGRAALLRLTRDRTESGVPESVLEERMLRLLRRFGLPEPVRQHEVRAARRKVRFDLAYPDDRIAVELDGRAPHWGKDRWQSDHDRHNATTLAGWLVLRFTWWDVHERPLFVVLTVGEAVGLRPTRWARESPARKTPGNLHSLR